MSKFYWNPETLEDMLYTNEVDIYNFCHDNTDWECLEDLDEIIEDFTIAVRDYEVVDFKRMMATKQADLAETIQHLRRKLNN